MTLHSLSYLKICCMAYFPDSFMTFRLQRCNSTTPWMQEHREKGKYCVYSMKYLLWFSCFCFLMIKFVNNSKKEDSVFFLNYFLFSSLETMVLFSVIFSETTKHKSSWSQLWNLEPLPTQLRARVRVTHSLSFFLSLAYIHIYTHAHSHCSPANSIHTGFLVAL